ESDGDVELTGTRMVVGTPPYMSPEQTYMKSDRERLELDIDGRSDLYSLGVILYEMLTGHRPFRGDAHELALAHRHDQPESPAKIAAADVPSGFVDLVLRLLAKAPKERPPSAAQVLATIRSLGASSAVPVSPRGQQEDAQEAATCIVDAVKLQAQEAHTAIADGVSLSTMATEAEEDIDFSSARLPRTPILVMALALCGAVGWAAWSYQTPERVENEPEVIEPGGDGAVVPSGTPAGSTEVSAAVPATPAASARTVSIMVTSVPPDAEVLLDGVLLGKTPHTTTLAAERDGKHLLEIQRDGYEVRHVPIAVAPHLAGKALVFDVVLEPDAVKRRGPRSKKKGGGRTHKGKSETGGAIEALPRRGSVRPKKHTPKKKGTIRLKKRDSEKKSGWGDF
ncbi:MAG: PEGA domain-containing protein, partial [Myxococcota bacterium]|nr:PEGA domain-containing protein [Myxococcota bacterium]